MTRFTVDVSVNSEGAVTITNTNDYSIIIEYRSGPNGNAGQLLQYAAGSTFTTNNEFNYGMLYTNANAKTVYMYLFNTAYNGGLLCVRGTSDSKNLSITKISANGTVNSLNSVAILSDFDCDGITLANGFVINSLSNIPDIYNNLLFGYAKITINPYGILTNITGYSINGTDFGYELDTLTQQSMRSGEISMTPAELYFTESSNDQNILHVPMESTTGTVITGANQSVQIPSSALLEVAQPKVPADVTIKYSGTSVPVVSNTPASRSRKKVT